MLWSHFVGKGVGGWVGVWSMQLAVASACSWPLCREMQQGHNHPMWPGHNHAVGNDMGQPAEDRAEQYHPTLFSTSKCQLHIMLAIGRIQSLNVLARRLLLSWHGLEGVYCINTATPC